MSIIAFLYSYIRHGESPFCNKKVFEKWYIILYLHGKVFCLFKKQIDLRLYEAKIKKKGRGVRATPNTYAIFIFIL